MTIHIIDPGYDWTSFLVGVGIVAVLLTIGFIVGWVTDTMDWSIIPFVLASLMAFIIACGVGYGVYLGNVHAAKVHALEEKGFTSVDLDNNGTGTLTANKDGVYFKGALIQDGDLTWQIAEVTK